MQRLLKPHGVFLLHLDWHAVHYAKVLCDGIFAQTGGSFQNELIWYYQTGGASKERFSRKHDTILFYANGKNFHFDGKAVAIPRGKGAMHRAKCATGARIKVTDTHKNPDDVLVVPALNPMARERNGYPHSETRRPFGSPNQGPLPARWGGWRTSSAAAAPHWSQPPASGESGSDCDTNPAAVTLARERLANGTSA